MKMIYEYEDERLRFYWHKKGKILVCDYLVKHADEDFVDFGIRKRLEITGNNSVVMISDITSIKSSTRRSRERLAQDDANRGIIAVGIVLRSKVQTMIYKFFDAIYKKQPVSTKIFSNKEDALKWAEQIIVNQ